MTDKKCFIAVTNFHVASSVSHNLGNLKIYTIMLAFYCYFDTFSTGD